MRWVSIVIVLLAILFNCVSCEKKPLTDKEAIMKAVRNDRDFNFESSYNGVTKKSFAIEFPGRYVPSFDEYFNSAVVIISNDIAVVTCSLAMESGDNMHNHQSATSHIIKLKKTDKKWKIIENTLSSSGGGTMSCGHSVSNNSAIAVQTNSVIKDSLKMEMKKQE